MKCRQKDKKIKKQIEAGINKTLLTFCNVESKEIEPIYFGSKCVRLVETGKIIRIKSALAANLVAEGKAAYVSKQVWKEERKAGKE